jgi:hypothetical protein
LGDRKVRVVDSAGRRLPELLLERHPEVPVLLPWRFGDEVMSIEQLDSSGNYVVVDASRFLFVPPAEVIRWLREAKSIARPAWKRAVREWARAELHARAGQ